jgi:hypothetical protein
MTMETLVVELPDRLREYAEQAARQRGDRNVSQYIQELLEADRARQLRAEFEASLRQAIRGPSSAFTEQDLAEIEEAALEQIEQEKQT